MAKANMMCLGNFSGADFMTSAHSSVSYDRIPKLC